ncbi:6-bladed beta-propeller [candidate division KSB1 bacterium]
MKYSYLFILLISFCLFSCGGGGTYVPPEEPLENILTLELSFGAENVPEEFLLANPMDLDVDNQGRVYVSDECRIKVFDENGNPLNIIGNQGQGPGEFEYPYMILLSISHSGHFMVNERLNGKISLFSPNGDFISRKYHQEFFLSKPILEKEGMMKTYPPGIFYLLGKDEIIFMIPSEISVSDNDEFTETLFYQNQDSILKVKSFEKRSIISTENPSGREFFAPLGELSFTPLPGDRIVYSHSSYDHAEEDGINSYLLNIINYRTMTEEKIKHQYEQMQLSDVEEFTSIYKARIDNSASERGKAYPIAVLEKINEKVEQGLKCAPHRDIMTDGEFIFVFTFKKNENGAIFTDVFNADDMLYVCSAYFDFIPDRIKNGYAYRLKTAQDEFPVVEKYRINEAVYGRLLF